MDIKQSQDFFLSDTHAFCLFKLNNQAMADIHGHEFDELVIVSHGCGFHVINDQTELIHQGDFFFVSANDVHYYDSTCDLSIINILFHKQTPFYFLKDIAPLLATIKKHTVPFTTGYHSLSEEALSRIVALAQGISDCRDDSFDRAYFALTESLLLGILSTLSRTLDHKQGRGNTGEKGVLFILNYIRKHYSQSVPWVSVGEMAGLSQRTMYRLFKEYTGTTPEKFQQTYRLLKAKDKLRTTDLAIKNIASDCGFINAAYLTELYKKNFSRTPSQERQLSRPVEGA